MGDTVYFSTGNVVLNVPPSGKNVVTMNNLPGSSVKPFIRQTASLVPGHSYRLVSNRSVSRYLY